MNYINKKNGYISAVVVMIIGFGLFIPRANAATEFMTSWQAEAYVPAWYTGAVFPTYQSVITVGFELLEEGKIVDLSKTAVRWYVGGKMLKNEENGLGIKQIFVFNKKYGGDVADIKITIPDYKGQSLVKLFDIPVKKPEVVLDAPYFQKKVAKGENIFYAWPFFFNASDAGMLTLQWTVDGNTLQTGKASDSSLVFSVGNEIRPGAKSAIEATVINQKRVMESVVNKMLVEVL